MRGELRERVEGVENAGYNETRDDLYYLSRLRLNISATGKRIGATVELQDARVAQKTLAPTGAPFSAPFDVRQAFMDVGSMQATATVRVGRQELAYGDQRLVGSANFTNAARVFDGVKATLRSKAVQVDVFGASVVRSLPTELDKSGTGNRLAGLYATSGRVVPKGTVEPYFFWRRDENQKTHIGSLADLDQFYSGVRLVGKVPAALDYNIEMSVQRGSVGGDLIRAWAGHWQLRRTLAGKFVPHVTGTYDAASGDANQGDARRTAYAPLYPTAHDKYGLADQIGWENIHHIRLGTDFTPFKAMPITVNYHSFWLMESKDALYTTSGAVVARVATGAASRHVGEELDVQVSKPLAAPLSLAVGYSHLFAGSFLKQATPGRSFSSVFVMITCVFHSGK